MDMNYPIGTTFSIGQRFLDWFAECYPIAAKSSNMETMRGDILQIAGYNPFSQVYLIDLAWDLHVKLTFPIEALNYLEPVLNHHPGSSIPSGTTPPRKGVSRSADRPLHRYYRPR